jgi:cardiolipin synthase
VKPSVRLSWTEGNAIDLLENGSEFFPALCEAIDGARSSVHLETYIFTEDSTAEKVLASLIGAVQRGVKVRVVIDGFGSATTAARVCKRIRDAGGQCRIFRPEPRWFVRWIPSRKRLRRLHRKVVVVDGAVAFVGGINIVDDYDDLKPNDGIPVPRFDFAVRVRGPLVSYATYAQELLWIRLNWQRLRRDPKDWRHLRLIAPRKAAPQPAAGTLRAALVQRDNLRFRQTFERAYLHGIENARREVLIANAYFLPGLQFRNALIDARKRGVRVRILVQGKVEYRMQYHATRALYAPLLEAGVEVIEYMPSYLHAKVAVIDDVASVGSSNIDPFSFLLAREANVVVDDAGFSRQLQGELEAAIARGGRHILEADYRHRGVVRRLADAVAYFMMRFAVSLSGVQGQY